MAVGEHFATPHAEFFHRMIPEGLIEILVGVLLHRKIRVLEKSEILDEFRRLGEVHEDADSAVLGRLEDRVQQADEVELGKLSILRV